MNIRYDRIRLYIFTFIKWVICSAALGSILGLIGFLFHFSIEEATKLREQYPFLLFGLPFAGLIIVACYRGWNVTQPKGTNLVIESIRSNEKIPFKMAPLIFIGTVLTHLCGGSSGREGAALQIGGSIAAKLGRMFHMNEDDIRILTMCGMSALFTALFGTPLTAVVFSMEVISVGVLYYTAFVPCIIASIIAFSLSTSLGMVPVHFVLIEAFNPSPNMIILLIFGALCAIISILFCIAMHKTAHAYKHFFPNPYIRIFIGGCLVIAITLLLQTNAYNGAGMEVITEAIHGNSQFEAFFFKIMFTALTLGAGFKGGEIVPTFFIGATFGNLCACMLGFSPSLGAALGLVAVFCGVVNCPLASLLLSVELFGSSYLMEFGLVIAVCYMLSGSYSLYSTQKIMYSKLLPKYINQSTR